MRFTYRGLDAECRFTKYTPATWIDPPEGGEVEDLTWEIEDIDAVLSWLELNVSEPVEDMVRTVFRLTGKVPQSITDKINRWHDDIELAAYEEWAEQ
tara:strand:+ start:19502 stop:19792 length:291 start_codon:yes stop_codon:yes gene_type:complete